MKKFSRGFTLIELLVVIAIIGILSSVVLASLSTARSKGNDAKIQEQLSGLRSAAEIYYSTWGGYGTVTSTACTSSLAGFFGDSTSGAQGIITGVLGTSGVTLTNCAAFASSSWAAAANLPSTAGTYWCVDSAGKSEKVNTTLTTTTFTSTLCP